MLTARAATETSTQMRLLSFFPKQTLQLQLTVDKNQESILTHKLTSN